MENKIGFFEKQFRKQEKSYCAKHGRLKFLQVYSKSFRTILILVIAGIVLSITSFLFANSLYLSRDDSFGKVWRILCYVGSGVFLFNSLILSIRLRFDWKKSKELKQELSEYDKTVDKLSK